VVAVAAHKEILVAALAVEAAMALSSFGLGDGGGDVV